jgi:hypothetical protein
MIFSFLRITRQFPGNLSRIKAVFIPEKLKYFFFFFATPFSLWLQVLYLRLKFFILFLENRYLRSKLLKLTTKPGILGNPSQNVVDNFNSGDHCSSANNKDT